MGTQLPHTQRGTAPQLSAHVCYGQMAGRIKMPLGTEVRLSPGHIVLDGDPALPPPKGHSPPVSGLCLLWPNGRPSQLLLSTFQHLYKWSPQKQDNWFPSQDYDRIWHKGDTKGHPGTNRMGRLVAKSEKRPRNHFRGDGMLAAGIHVGWLI